MNKREVTLMSVALLCGLIMSSNARAEETPQPEATPAEPKISDIVGYEKGFYIQSPDKDYRLVIGGYTQGYFERKFLDSKSDSDTFRVRRARLKFAGNVFSKNVQYELEYDFAGNKLLEGVLHIKPYFILHFLGGFGF